MSEKKFLNKKPYGIEPIDFNDLDAIVGGAGAGRISDAIDPQNLLKSQKLDKKTPRKFQEIKDKISLLQKLIKPKL